MFSHIVSNTPAGLHGYETKYNWYLVVRVGLLDAEFLTSGTSPSNSPSTWPAYNYGWKPLGEQTPVRKCTELAHGSSKMHGMLSDSSGEKLSDTGGMHGIDAGPHQPGE